MNIRLLNTTIIAVIVTLCLCTSLPIGAEPLTAADYVALELEARRITLDGVKDRLILLQGSADFESQLQHDSNTRQQVDSLYQIYGVTLPGALVWASHNRQAINDYLAERPDQQAEYERIADELDAVSKQIQTLLQR